MAARGAQLVSTGNKATVPKASSTRPSGMAKPGGYTKPGKTTSKIQPAMKRLVS